MDLHLTGKRVLVTGASKGIGRATATLLAQEGCDLVLVARGAAALDAAAAAIRASSTATVETIAADLSQQTDVERVARESGPLDVLVNNAGAIPPGDLSAVDDARWRTAWDLKVFGYIGLTRALYANLKERRGVIVNVIGAGGEYFDPNYIAGSSGNAALMAFTRSLGKAAAKDHMRVIGINPGPVATDRIERSYAPAPSASSAIRSARGNSMRACRSAARRRRRDRERRRVSRLTAIGLHDGNDPHDRRRTVVVQRSGWSSGNSPQREHVRAPSANRVPHVQTHANRRAGVPTTSA